jgi:hypothetical protein
MKNDGVADCTGTILNFEDGRGVDPLPTPSGSPLAVTYWLRSSCQLPDVV